MLEHDVSEHMTSISHEWKLQVFDLFYCELKIRFPITAEMLLDLRDLIQTKYPDAQHAFDIDLLRVSTKERPCSCTWPYVDTTQTHTVCFKANFR